MRDLADSNGFTLVESLIACALLATALLSIGYLSTNAIARVTDSRNRTLATIIAAATLEELRTTAAPVAGSDVVDSRGQAVQRESVRRFERRWSVASVSQNVQILTIVVTPLPVVAGREVRMTGAWMGPQ